MIEDGSLAGRHGCPFKRFPHWRLSNLPIVRGVVTGLGWPRILHRYYTLCTMTPPCLYIYIYISKRRGATQTFEGSRGLHCTSTVSTLRLCRQRCNDSPQGALFAWPAVHWNARRASSGKTLNQSYLDAQAEWWEKFNRQSLLNKIADLYRSNNYNLPRLIWEISM